MAWQSGEIYKQYRKEWDRARLEKIAADGGFHCTCGVWVSGEEAMTRMRCSRCQRNSALKSTYGIDIHQYERMLEAQDGECLLCGGLYDSKKRNLCVDHNHTTGEVRALLCDWCNRTVGKIEARLDMYKSMIEYIERTWG